MNQLQPFACFISHHKAGESRRDYTGVGSCTVQVIYFFSPRIFTDETRIMAICYSTFVKNVKTKIDT